MNEISEKVAAGWSEGKNKKWQKSREQMFHKAPFAIIIVIILIIAVILMTSMMMLVARWKSQLKK